MPLQIVGDTALAFDVDKYVVECPLGCFVPSGYATERPYHEHRRRNIPYCPDARAGRQTALRKRRNPQPAIHFTASEEHSTAETLEELGKDAVSGITAATNIREGWLVRHLGQWRLVIGRSVRSGHTFLSFDGGLQTSISPGGICSVVHHVDDTPTNRWGVKSDASDPDISEYDDYDC